MSLKRAAAATPTPTSTPPLSSFDSHPRALPTPFTRATQGKKVCTQTRRLTDRLLLGLMPRVKRHTSYVDIIACKCPLPPIHSSASSASSSSLADARPGRTPKPAWSSRIFTTGSDSSQIITILAISIHLFDDTHEEMHVNTRTARRWSFDWTDCSDTLIQFLDSTKLVIIVNQSREGLDRRSSLCPSQRSSGRTATAVVWESGSVRASAGCLRLVGLVAFGPCWFGLWLFGLWLFGLCLARALFGSGFVWLGLCSTRALFDSGLALRLFLLVLVALSG